MGLTYGFSHKQLDKHYKQWVKTDNASPIPKVKCNYYNTTFHLKPNGSEALKGLENTYNE